MEQAAAGPALPRTRSAPTPKATASAAFFILVINRMISMEHDHANKKGRAIAHRSLRLAVNKERLRIVPARVGTTGLSWLFRSPFPAADCGEVVAVFRDVFLVLDQLLVDRLFEVRGPRAELRQPIYHVVHEMEAIQLIEHDHVEGG